MDENGWGTIPLGREPHALRQGRRFVGAGVARGIDGWGCREQDAVDMVEPGGGEGGEDGTGQNPVDASVGWSPGRGG